MIKIEERRSEKLSGYTSLFLSFNNCTKFDDIIAWLKTGLDIYNYNKKSFEWETLVSKLNDIVNYLNRYDDITVSLYDEEPRIIKQLTLSEYKLKPYKHQEEAIIFGLQPEHKKWLLLDDMGLGKTASIIHIAEELKKREGIKHCFIICGINTLKGNWKKEISLHSNETFRVIGEKVSKNGVITYSSIKDRVNELKSPIDAFFIIVNIETLRSDEFIAAFKQNVNQIDMLVCDEVHKCSNKNSKQGNNFLKLDATYKIAATGTILTNSPINAYLPLKWIDVDKSNLTNYKRQYCKFGGFGGHEIVGYKNIDILKDELDRCSLRRTKEVLGDVLPPKTIINEIVTLSEEHRNFYNAVKQGVKEECDKINLNSNSVLALVTRLRQATACPAILTSNTIKSSKIDRAVDLAEDIIDNGNKVVIFSTYKQSIQSIVEELKKYNPLVCTGDSTDQEIDRSIDQFQNNPEYKLLIGTHQKMGTGVTLNAASYMIFIDTPFTAASYNQACDRIYRIGTKNPVFIYNLICEDTVDEKVAKIVSGKQAMSDYIVDDKLDDKTISILREYIMDL